MPKLPVGMVLSHRLRDGTTVTAKVVAGGIELGGRTFTSPSGAARSITGKPVDGWRWWSMEDGRQLDALRQA